MRTWESADYGAAPGNLCIAQSPRTGFIYVGNNQGLLEFDSVRWRLIRPPGRVPVRTLAIDRRGQIWTANEDVICCLQPDSRGELQAVSVVDRLPPSVRVFRAAVASLAADDGVYIGTLKSLFYFPSSGGPARAWPLPVPGMPLRLWMAEGALHLQQIDGAVWQLRADALERVTGRDLWVGSLLGSSAAGALASEAAMLRPHGDQGPICAAKLAGGCIAFGTATAGLVILDPQGHEVQRIDRSHGLPSSRIEDMCEDTEGGVWLALRNGLARIQLDSPYAVHGQYQRFEGSPTDLQLYHGRLFVSCTEGLAERQPDGNFLFVENVLHVARDLVLAGDRLFVTGRDLQVVSAADEVTTIEPRAHQGLISLRISPGMWVHGAPDGLWLAHEQGRAMERRGRFPKPAGSVQALLEEPIGVVWALALDSGEVWQMDFRSAVDLHAPARRLGAADGLTGRFAAAGFRPFRLGGSLEALVRGKLRRYDPATGKFGPETRIAGWTQPDPAIALVRNDEQGTPWLQLGAGGAARVVRLDPDGAGRWRATAINAPPLRYLQASVMLPDLARHTLWLGGPEKLISEDLAWQPATPPVPLVAEIRSVSRLDGTAVWNDGAGAGSLRLPHRQRDLRFDFTAATFVADQSGRGHRAFRTRLDGFDAGWEPWGPAATREVTNLPFRSFTLEVQARDGEGRTSPSALLNFAILPPWWLAPWALAAETLIAIALVAAVTRQIVARSLRRRVELLEARAAIEAERLRLARDMHDNLGSGLGRIALLGQSVVDRPGEAAAGDKLQKIIETARSLNRATRDIIWAVNPQYDTVAELAEHLAQQAEEALGEAGIACATQVGPDFPAVVMGAGARHDLLLAVKEAVHNAIKYSEAKRAEFSVRAGAGKLVVTLRDFGRGFAPGECRGTGFGVASMAARMTAHGGSGQVTGAEGQGATVTLTLPLPSPK